MNHLLLAGLIMLILLIITTIIIYRERKRDHKQVREFKPGNYLVKGMSFGLILGVPIGLISNNLGLGIGIGLGIGVVIGSVWEKRRHRELKKLTQVVKRSQNMAVIAGIYFLALAIVVFIILFLT